MAEKGLSVIKITDKAYPSLLKKIHKAPKQLYVMGSMLKDAECAVAIVGSRLASLYGITSAQKLAYELASKGVVVVSGLARGIDSAAHKGSLKAGGRTIAVLGSGPDNIYPPENKKLASEIVEKGGAVISEFPPGTPPVAINFPQRNRIISGLSLGVVVVEAAKNSGALITADFALEQNREVFAVPGNIDSAKSFGTNELIKQGAKPVITAEDILQELGLRLSVTDAGEEKILRPNLSSDEETIYENMSAEPKYVDDIAGEAGLSANKALELLMKLQLKKLVKELPGKNFIKAG
ncbi:MAG: DNA-processing protein DprA [Candidatus Omnitrophica bacterium]|nr:DNA-processing protein DprA [Candidatus Omnitrophota bacterium]